MNALPPNAGKGRPKGVPNKITREIRDMVGQALVEAGGEEGGVGYLKRQAVENPAAFLALVGKIIPKEIDSKVTVSAGSPEDKAWVENELKAMGMDTGKSE